MLNSGPCAGFNGVKTTYFSSHVCLAYLAKTKLPLVSMKWPCLTTHLFFLINEKMSWHNIGIHFQTDTSKKKKKQVYHLGCCCCCWEVGVNVVVTRAHQAWVPAGDLKTMLFAWNSLVTKSGVPCRQREQ